MMSFAEYAAAVCDGQTAPTYDDAAAVLQAMIKSDDFDALITIVHSQLVTWHRLQVRDKEDNVEPILKPRGRQNSRQKLAAEAVAEFQSCWDSQIVIPGRGEDRYVAWADATVDDLEARAEWYRRRMATEQLSLEKIERAIGVIRSFGVTCLRDIAQAA